MPKPRVDEQLSYQNAQAATFIANASVLTDPNAVKLSQETQL
jgi:hypothetical protein